MSYVDDSAKWEAVQTKDAKADGHFFYAVKTTGIFCRPGCSSKEPKRENVLFFFTCNEALNANFRPCKRCTPQKLDKDYQITEAITKACRLLDNDPKASLEDVSKEAGFSPYHFHRLFKKNLGVTPKQYAQQVKTKLYGNPMKKSLHVNYAIAPCSLGYVMITESDKGIYTIELGDNEEALIESFETHYPKVSFTHKDLSSIKEVIALIDDPSLTCTLPLDIQGTAFQRRVWQELQRIPVGQTLSYSEVAEKIGKPSATRAVARACATNKIGIIIPCHRVVRSDGSISGYRWGVQRKATILEREKKSS